MGNSTAAGRGGPTCRRIRSPVISGDQRGGFENRWRSRSATRQSQATAGRASGSSTTSAATRGSKADAAPLAGALAVDDPGVDDPEVEDWGVDGAIDSGVGASGISCVGEVIENESS